MLLLCMLYRPAEALSYPQRISCIALVTMGSEGCLLL